MKLLALLTLPLLVTALPEFLTVLTTTQKAIQTVTRTSTKDLISINLRPAATCVPFQYCVLVCTAPNFNGTCNTVCGPNGECRLIQNGLNNNVFSARTTCGAGVYL